jgi:hypothetical protein
MEIGHVQESLYYNTDTHAREEAKASDPGRGGEWLRPPARLGV